MKKNGGKRIGETRNKNEKVSFPPGDVADNTQTSKTNKTTAYI